MSFAGFDGDEVEIHRYTCCQEPMFVNPSLLVFDVGRKKMKCVLSGTPLTMKPRV